MRKAPRSLTTMLLVLAVPAAALMARTAEAGPVRDQLGRQVMVPDNPQRMVSLAPSITGIVFALGEGERLKGVTQHCDYPPQARSLPKVGSYVHLDVEKIVALKPDLCLGTRDGNPREVAEKLEAMNIPVYAVNPRDKDLDEQAIGADQYEKTLHWFYEQKDKVPRNFEKDEGKCGSCEYARVCGGCRARAYETPGATWPPSLCVFISPDVHREGDVPWDLP